MSDNEVVAEDQDLIDHLDPTHPFELDIGVAGAVLRVRARPLLRGSVCL